MELSRKDRCLATRVGDEMVMLHIDRGEYVALNETAAEIWEMLESPRDLEEICANLVERFEINSQQCRSEVLRFVTEMVDRDALIVSPSTTE